MSQINTDFKYKFLEAINDDLNMPRAMAVIQEMLKSNIGDTEKCTTILDFDRVLGLKLNQLDKTQALPEAAAGMVTTFVYDANNRLQYKSKGGNVIASYTYDSIGRIITSTDETGLTLAFEYNDLNMITKITYPDGKFESRTYASSCP